MNNAISKFEAPFKSKFALAIQCIVLFQVVLLHCDVEFMEAPCNGDIISQRLEGSSLAHTSANNPSITMRNHDLAADRSCMCARVLL